MVGRVMSVSMGAVSTGVARVVAVAMVVSRTDVASPVVVPGHNVRAAVVAVADVGRRVVVGAVARPSRLGPGRHGTEPNYCRQCGGQNIVCRHLLSPFFAGEEQVPAASFLCSER